MRFYYSPDISSEWLERVNRLRFPGLGVNAIILSFILLIIFSFTLYAWLDRKISFIYPVVILISIAICGSKTIFIIAFMMSLAYLYFSHLTRKTKIYVFTSFVSAFALSIFSFY